MNFAKTDHPKIIFDMDKLVICFNISRTYDKLVAGKVTGLPFMIAPDTIGQM